MKNKLKFVLMTGLLALFALALAGCNTTRGMGEDVEQLGEEIQDMS